MNLIIKSIKNAGIVKDERLVLKVLKDDDIGNYVIFKTTSFEDNSVTNKVRHAYWFPDKDVQTGDLVVLYTKSGKNVERYNDKSGHTSHFFYWGMKETIWGEKTDSAVLLEVGEWENKSASD